MYNKVVHVIPTQLRFRPKAITRSQAARGEYECQKELKEQEKRDASS